MFRSRAGIKDLDVDDIKGKRVVMRIECYDVGLHCSGLHSDRCVRVLIPTIDMLFDRGAKSIVLLCNFGSPHGHPQFALTLRCVAKVLGGLLENRKVYFVYDPFGSNVARWCADEVEDGSVVLLENIGFCPEEEGRVNTEWNNFELVEKDQVDLFRAELSQLAELYVNDALTTASVNHSSVVGVSAPIRVAGLWLEKQLGYLAHILEPTERPVVAILGGEYLNNRIAVISNLLEKVDTMIISGGLSYTFLTVMHGIVPVDSLFDEESAKVAAMIIEKAKEKNVELVFCEDFQCEIHAGDPGHIISGAVEIPRDWRAIEYGPKTLSRFKSVIARAKAIIWLGCTYVLPYWHLVEQSRHMLDMIIEATKNGCTTVVYGGFLRGFLIENGAYGLVSYIFDTDPILQSVLEGNPLPGIQALSSKLAVKIKPNCGGPHQEARM